MACTTESGINAPPECQVIDTNYTTESGVGVSVGKLISAR
jgi:hypothetical protein